MLAGSASTPEPHRVRLKSEIGKKKLKAVRLSALVVL
jgi:hypothetical protein